MTNEKIIKALGPSIKKGDAVMSDYKPHLVKGGIGNILSIFSKVWPTPSCEQCRTVFRGYADYAFCLWEGYGGFLYEA